MKLELFSDDILMGIMLRDSGVLINHLATATMFDASTVGILIEIGKQAIADELTRRELLRIAENVPVATENFVFQDDGNTSDRYASDTRPDDDKDYHEFTLAPIASELMQQIAEAEAEFRHDETMEAASPYSDMPL